MGGFSLDVIHPISLAIVELNAMVQFEFDRHELGLLESCQDFSCLIF
jgi:hypothetical protein